MSKLIDSNKAWGLIDKTIAKIQNNNYVAEQKWFDELWKDFVDLPDKSIDIKVQDNYKQSYTLFSKEDEKLLYQLTDIINGVIAAVLFGVMCKSVGRSRILF